MTAIKERKIDWLNHNPSAPPQFEPFATDDDNQWVNNSNQKYLDRITAALESGGVRCLIITTKWQGACMSYARREIEVVS